MNFQNTKIALTQSKLPFALVFTIQNREERMLPDAGVYNENF